MYKNILFNDWLWFIVGIGITYIVWALSKPKNMKDELPNKIPLTIKGTDIIIHKWQLYGNKAIILALTSYLENNNIVYTHIVVNGHEIIIKGLNSVRLGIHNKTYTFKLSKVMTMYRLHEKQINKDIKICLIHK